MQQLLGEFECRLDPKGRLMLPAGLRRQLALFASSDGDPSPINVDSDVEPLIRRSDSEKIIVNRGFERCLVLFPYDEWLKESAVVSSLNIYRKEVREFVRHFSRGATELMPDGTGRVLIPQPLLDYASIDKDLVLSAFGRRIEVWSKSAYEAMLSGDNDQFADLAERVLGKGVTSAVGASSASREEELGVS